LDQGHADEASRSPAGAPAVVDNARSQTAMTSDALFNGKREVTILHNGVSYRLRITAADKLILTK
jgi:hemin uptake protein HemP